MWVKTENDLDSPLLNAIIERPDSVILQGKKLKHDQTTTVAVVSDEQHEWIIKRYNTKSRWHALRRLFQTSRASNCWRAAAWLSAADIGTARPVAVLEERLCRVVRGRSYFVSEFISGETLESAMYRRNRDRYIELTASIIRKLGENRIVHGDMKATNFIVSDGRVFLVDLDATRRVSGKRLARGLEKDRRRFLRNWVDHPDIMRKFEKKLGEDG